VIKSSMDDGSNVTVLAKKLGNITDIDISPGIVGFLLFDFYASCRLKISIKIFLVANAVAGTCIKDDHCFLAKTCIQTYSKL